MRERLITLACALGALGVFATLFLRTGVPGDRDVPGPTSREAKGNGLLGVMTWLKAEGIPTVSLRERYGVLATRHDIPATGNLLVLALPAVTAYRTEEAAALDKWVRAGNTVLVLAALSDRPDWAADARIFVSDLSLLTGLDTKAVADHEQDEREPQGSGVNEGAEDPDSSQRAWIQKRARDLIEFSEPQRSELVANRPHPYLEAVHQAIALSDYPPIPRVVKVPRDGFVLALAHEGKDHQGVLWVRPLGDGTIIVSGFASLFTNRALGLADNARLFANIVANCVRGGVVIFDDEHQGLSVIYDPDKFYKDGRLYATLAVIALTWLVWVLGGTQLHAAQVRASAPRETELVRATGLYLARVLRPAAAARRLIDNFLHGSNPSARASGAGQEPWQRLEAHPRLARSDVTQLRAWHEQASAGGKVPLTALRNLIVRIERQLNA